jgi:hypothetical protein
MFVRADRILMPQTVHSTTLLTLIKAIEAQPELKVSITAYFGWEIPGNWGWEVTYQEVALESPARLIFENSDFVSDDWNVMKFYQTKHPDGEEAFVEAIPVEGCPQ